MKHIVIIAAAVLLIFFLIAFNLSDYNNLSTRSKEARISESIRQAQLDAEAANTERSIWDKVHDLQEKNKTTTAPEEENDMPLFMELRDENNEIYGYQQVENVTYDDEGNIQSFDKVGNMLTPEEYQKLAEEYNQPEETTVTKRPIPDIPSKKQTEQEFVITVR